MTVRRRLVIAWLLGLALASPAQAGGPSDPFARLDSLLEPRVLLQGVIREDDVALLFSHLRAILLAAGSGRDAPPPPQALERRVDEVVGELRTRGTLAGLALLAAFEEATRQALREALEGAAPAAR
jgi:hypothetical protein